MSKFIRDLVRKSERALKSARLDLRDEDTDSSVNRSYYAMFNVARAALLSAGVTENELPRTHNGVIAAFAQHAVQSGRIDPVLAAALGRAEALRLRADYSGTEIDPKDAAECLARAESFVDTVARVFALHEPFRATELDNDNPDQGDKISEPGNAIERTQRNYPPLQSFSLEEERRQARENWLRLRRQKTEGAKDIGHERETGGHVKEELGHSPGIDLDE
ncbi:MAG TPA: HEPN domain-containing protein [Steroidobacteraceae bacterium]|nr:HEPN domain-containing protein [Steroidobacteraceae bacterium]